MESAVDIAAYTTKRYYEISGTNMDEMKLQKILYFIQRETIAITGDVAFCETLRGWKYGPVCKEVRSVFCNGEIVVPTKEISNDLKYIINNVISEYGQYESWKLAELSHKESSWINARKGLAPDENGDTPLALSDIRKDAEKIRPYDYVWDMYYDEFETAEEITANVL